MLSFTLAFDYIILDFFKINFFIFLNRKNEERAQSYFDKFFK